MRVRRVDKTGRSSEIEVCADCARKQGFVEAEQVKSNVGQVLAEMKASRTAADERRMVCTRCGLTFAQFKRTGRLGCANCYDSFREKLEPLVRRLHNSVQHVGKTVGPGRTEAQKKLTVRRLNAELAKAIEQEDYERAAQLRDQLRKVSNDVQR